MAMPRRISEQHGAPSARWSDTSTDGAGQSIQSCTKRSFPDRPAAAGAVTLRNRERVEDVGESRRHADGRVDGREPDEYTGIESHRSLREPATELQQSAVLGAGKRVAAARRE